MVNRNGGQRWIQVCGDNGGVECGRHGKCVQRDVGDVGRYVSAEEQLHYWAKYVTI